MSNSTRSSRVITPSSTASGTQPASANSTTSRLGSRAEPAGRVRPQTVSATPPRFSTASTRSVTGPPRNPNPGSKRPPALSERKAGIGPPAKKPQVPGSAAPADDAAGPTEPTRRPPPLPGQKAGVNNSSDRREKAGSATVLTTVEVPRPDTGFDDFDQVDTWKVKYEQQYEETQKLRDETAQTESNLRLLIKEQEEKLAATEPRLQAFEQVKSEAERSVVLIQRLRVDLRERDQEITRLKDSKEQLSMELIHSRNEVGRLEDLAKLTGELQTELDFARNVKIPELEQTGEALKKELRQMIEDAAALSSLGERDAAETKALREELRQLHEKNEKLHQSFEASEILLLENEKYIAQLEKTNDEVNDRYADAVKVFDGKENRITALEKTRDELTRKNMELMADKERLEQKYKDVQARMQALEDETHAKLNHPFAGDKASAPPAFSHLSSVKTTGHILPLPAHATAQTDLISRSNLAMANLQFLAIRPAEPIQTPSPRPPLDKDVHITINVEATSRRNLSLLERLAQITTRDSTFHINGPADIAKALAHGMEDAKAEAAYNKAKVLSLQQMLWKNIGEIERLKKEGCSVAEHRKLTDDLAAKQAQIEMQDLMLANYGRGLARMNERGA